MKQPKDLKPGDKCYLVTPDLKCKILNVKEVQTNKSTWITFKEPISAVFCTPEVKEFVRAFPHNLVFFDKERTLTYLRNKVKRINKDIEKIEKT